MKDNIIASRNRLLAASYKHIAKPLFFKCDPESVHDFVSTSARIVGHVPFAKSGARALFGYSHPSLEQDVLGMHCKNPIGLSAGFDKNAELTHIMPYSGFGFMEVGSITGEQCDGNPKPRLWRLPEQQSLVVWYGLKNNGAEAVAARMAGKTFQFPVGINLAKTNSLATCDDARAIADYVKGARAFKDIGDYFTINISCPNTYGGEPFIDPERLELLLSAIDAVGVQKPIFIKLSPDLSRSELDAILDVASKHAIDGFVSSNLTKKRDTPTLSGVDVPRHGGMSGKLVSDASDAQIRHIYKRFGSSKTIIGVGGVFTAEDAYRKIRAGASLVQLITGMIYQGPQCISDINRGLVTLLERDGYTSITEVIGLG